MSRLLEIKKQYPHFNLSVIDVLCELDKSGTYKYLPLFCKILDKGYLTFSNSYPEEREKYREEVTDRLVPLGINLENSTLKRSFQMLRVLDFFNSKEIETLVEFQKMNEKGLIPEKDLSKYNNFDMVSTSLTLAQIKEADKEFTKQIIKLYEDDKWLILRPLTFESSAKYGSGTKWCTTYNSKEYFFKYWYNGILTYFINKVTGYKFAGFKGTEVNESLSFWDSSDERRDFLDLEIDDYLFPEIKKVFSSKKSNHLLCDDELRITLLNQYDKYYSVVRMSSEVAGPTPEINIEQFTPNHA